MEVLTQQLLARRFAALSTRYRAIKEGKLPWWELLWEAMRSRSRCASLRRRRKAMRADVERLRAKLRQDRTA